MSADLVLTAVPADPDLLRWLRTAVISDIGGFYDELSKHDWFWVGQVSYMKAEIMGDPDRYIPGQVAGVHELTTGLPRITPTLITALMVAMSVPNRSIYGRRGVVRPRKLKQWLMAHLGMHLVVDVE